MDDSGKETNLPMGSVTYAIPVKIKEAAVGDSILYQTDSKAYRYMITEMDKKNHIFKVIDSSDKNAEPSCNRKHRGTYYSRTCRPFPGNSVYSCGTSEKRTAG